MGRRLDLLAPILVVAGLAVLLAACGGSGGGRDDERTLTIPSDAGADGLVTNTGFVDASSEISVGDTDGGFGNVARGLVRFSLSGIPADATLVSAELRLFQFAVVGSPYATHGDVVVEHVDIGAALDASDFDQAPLHSAPFGVLSANFILGRKTLSVTTQVAVDIGAARAFSDYRLSFELASDADGEDDYASFNDGQGSSDTAALLVVTYRKP